MPQRAPARLRRVGRTTANHIGRTPGRDRQIIRLAAPIGNKSPVKY